MRTIRKSISRGAFALTLLGAATMVQAVGVVGKLTTEHSATVDSSGLEVRLRPQQDYIIFSGDRIETGADGWSVLDIPGTGKIGIAPDSLVRVEAVDGNYQLHVERGQATYDIDPASGFEVIAGDRVVTLTGSPASTLVTPDDRQSYHTVRYDDGNIQMTDLNSGELVYEGPAEQSGIPLYAQVGAGPGVGFGLGGAASAWGLLPPLTFLSVVGAASLTDDGDDDDDRPASPVAP